MKLIRKVTGICLVAMVLGVCKLPGTHFLSPVLMADSGLGFELSVAAIDEDVYLKIEVNDPDNTKVLVDGDSTNVLQFNDDNYYYRIKHAGEYRVEVENSQGERGVRFYTVSLDQNPPEIKLSRKYVKEDCYLVISIKDESKIKNVTVNGEKLNFNENGDENVEYKVKDSKTYTVAAEDEYHNTTSKDIYIDTSKQSSAPQLKLSKDYRDDGWYLIIDAKDNYGIKEVTVNGKKIAFGKKEDSRYYKVENTGTYHVEVTNEDGNTATEGLYIDKDEKVSIPPEVTVKQLDDQQTKLVISIKDNGKIESVKVNDETVSYNSQTGEAIYNVKKTGIYHIHVVDDEGNDVEKIINVEQIKVNTVQHNVVYTLGSKDWKKDDALQTQLLAAPEVKGGKIYMPLRAVAESIGIYDVSWDQTTGTGIIRDKDTVVKIKKDSDTIEVNGQMVPLDGKVVTIKGKLMLPFAAVTKAFANKEVKVEWNNEKKQLNLTYIETLN